MSNVDSAFDRSGEAADRVRTRDTREPTVALILGSGLGAYADTLEDATRLPYGEIPHFHSSTVAGHSGTLVIGRRHGLTIARARRLHAYEGHTHAEVVFPLRTMRAALGARTLLVTNAAGGMSEGGCGLAHAHP